MTGLGFDVSTSLDLLKVSAIRQQNITYEEQLTQIPLAHPGGN